VDYRKYMLIIGAIVVAMLFWLFVVLNNTYTTTMSVPLKIVDLPMDVAISNALPQTVDVSLTGTGWQLLILAVKKNLVFNLPGERIHSNRVLFPNKYLNEALKLPANVFAVRVFPESLDLEVDLFLRKRVPVRLVVDSITFRENFGLSGQVRIEPDSVVIMGADKVLRQINSWPTVPRAYTRLSKPVWDEVFLADSLPGIVRFSREPLKVYIPVEQMADVAYRDIEIRVQDVPKDRQVLLERPAIDIYVRGGVNRLAQLQSDEITATIDYQALLKDSTGTIIPSVRLPEGLFFLKSEPSRIKFTIRQ
jgi:hypothetical protein